VSVHRGSGSARSRRARRLLVGPVVGLVVLALVAGCSSDEGGTDTTAPLGTVPSSTGDSCTDPAGDLDLPVGVTADTPGLAGVDLVAAEAVVDGDRLDITFTTAGPVDEAPAATYVVAQGDPLGSLSFELRMVRGAGGWDTTLITWPGGVEERRALALTPTVVGDELRISLPLEGLPPVALVLQFGASADVGDAIAIDDCSSLDAG
jgi:hypothetical protein